MNKALENSENGFVQFGEVDTRWATAQDAVDYPVWVLPAHYDSPIYHGGKTMFKEAIGMTNTGRDKQFCLVVVDKLRDNDLQTIASVTDTYGSLETKDVYNQLQQELAVSEHTNTVERLFVSANGGMHQLTVRLNDMMSMEGVPDALTMMIRLNTSVDGSKAQSLSMMIHNPESDSDIHAYGGDYTLSARHTKTIGERSAYYIPTIQKMIVNWNDVIMPTMALMYDCEFNRNVALEMISQICADAKMGDQHTKNVSDLYTSIGLKTKAEGDSLYRINIAMNQYLDDELISMHDTKQKFKDSATRSIQKHLNKLKK